MINLNIIILQRGWVVVGDLHKDGPYFVLKKGHVIRRWGTTKGLGQLAIEGPQPETILDPMTEFKFHELVAIGIMKCDESKWTSQF